MSELQARLAWVHGLVLDVGQKVGEGTLTRSPGPGAAPIAWHLWHIARASDRFQARLGAHRAGSRDGEQGQIWHRDGLGGRWGFDARALGPAGTGQEMEPQKAAGLPWPERGELQGYLGRALEAAQAAIEELDEAALAGAGLSEGATLGDDLLSHLIHVSRHLGMIEGLRGVLGERGSATV